jgi:hypothetical protein
VGPASLYKSAQEQLKKVEEIKKVTKEVRDEAEDWQSVSVDDIIASIKQGRDIWLSLLAADMSVKLHYLHTACVVLMSGGLLFLPYFILKLLKYCISYLLQRIYE